MVLEKVLVHLIKDIREYINVLKMLWVMMPKKQSLFTNIFLSILSSINKAEKLSDTSTIIPILRILIWDQKEVDIGLDIHTFVLMAEILIYISCMAQP